MALLALASRSAAGVQGLGALGLLGEGLAAAGVRAFSPSATAGQDLRAFVEKFSQYDDEKFDERPPPAGKAWEAKDLRTKSWEDLHKLWYVLSLEKNYLASEKVRFAREGKVLPDARRKGKVKLSMNRIKQVLGERVREVAASDPKKARELKYMMDAL